MTDTFPVPTMKRAGMTFAADRYYTTKKGAESRADALRKKGARAETRSSKIGKKTIHIVYVDTGFRQ